MSDQSTTRNRKSWKIFIAKHAMLLMAIASVCSTEAVTTVYNLRVADHHTYFIGGAEWGWDVWVHNAYSGPKNRASAATHELLETLTEIRGAKAAGIAMPEVHHIATNKSSFWTKKFTKLFEPAGIELDDPINKVALLGHDGGRNGHGFYNLVVLTRLQDAVADAPNALRYKRLLQRELLSLRRDILDESNPLNGILRMGSTPSENALAKSLGTQMGY